VLNAVEIEIAENIAILRFNREEALNALTVE
jgi:enoyl-CoA hydratase